MINYNELIFRRQFLLTPDSCKTLDHWQHKTLSSLNLYVHPDVELSIFETIHKKSGMALIGFMIDPNNPNRSNIEILAEMQNFIQSPEDISKYLYNISGRFVLIINNSTDTIIFHDPCGLRSVYYTTNNGKMYVGSQPLIFKHVMPLIFCRRGMNF